MVKIKITNAGKLSGYLNGETYEVEPAEAKRLNDAGECEILSTTHEPKKETAAAAGPGKAEKAVVK